MVDNSYNSEYWRKRMGEVTNTSLELSTKTMKELSDAFEAMGREISKEINDLLSRYPSKSDLLKRADRTDLNRIKVMMKVSGYDINDPKVIRDLHKLNRMESTLQQIGLIIKQHYDNNSTLLTDHFISVYGHVVGQMSEDFDAMGIATNPNMLVLSKDQMQQVLTEKWSGQNYSDIWKGHEKILESTLKSTLQQGFVNGLSMDAMAKMVTDKINTSYYNAIRLIRTETIYVSNMGALNSFKNSGVVEWFKFDAHLDNRTSEICTTMDMEDKVYHINDAQIGVNVPPLHPNCRSTIIPYIPRFEKDGHLYPTKHTDFIEKQEAERKKKEEAERQKMAQKYGNRTFKDKNDVVRHLKKECGFNSVSLKGIDFDMACDIGNTLGAVFNKYPIMKGKVEAFIPNTSSENAYASITSYFNRITRNITKMEFHVNPKLLGTVEGATRNYLRDLSSGFHPAGTDYKDIFVHECGHILDNIVGGGKHSMDFAKEIADNAFREMGYKTSSEIDEGVKSVSKYGTQSLKELWAEAFADYYHNEDKANPLSIALYKEFEKKYIGGDY